MVAKRFEFVLRVGYSGRFDAVIDQDWLGAESIISATATTGSALIAISPTVVIDGGTLSITVSATAAGVSDIHFAWVTSSGRGDCDTAALKTINC